MIRIPLNFYKLVTIDHNPCLTALPYPMVSRGAIFRRVLLKEGTYLRQKLVRSSADNFFIVCRSV